MLRIGVGCASVRIDQWSTVRSESYRWFRYERVDVFISHASEDKEIVPLPLAEALRRSGVRVSVDRQELMIGDSFRSKIDHGLAHSRFGMVILTEAFFSKQWTLRERGGLLAIEEAPRHRIPPV